MINKEQKEKALVIMKFLETKVDDKVITGVELVDRSIFDTIYRLDGMINGMYDEEES